MPSAFSLSPNYPNPFNNGTVIRFSLPTSTRARLTVHNLLGQSIPTLVDDIREPGTHAVNWGGRDDNGRQLGTGVYLYRLEAGKLAESR